MKFYKFLNNYYIEEYTKSYVYVDDVQISYPSAEILLKAGIKPLVVEDVPAYNEDTQYVEIYYVETDTEIIQKWNVYDYPNDEVIEYESPNA